MKKTFLNIGFALMIGVLTFSSCSKKAKEESKEATEAVSEDVKDAATETKEGAQDVASDVKEAGKDAVSDVKDAAHETADAADSKADKLSASAHAEYVAVTNEIDRLDAKIAKASAAEKIKLEKTKEIFVKKRKELIGE